MTAQVTEVFVVATSVARVGSKATEVATTTIALLSLLIVTVQPAFLGCNGFKGAGCTQRQHSR